jgi:hypothetical protein
LKEDTRRSNLKFSPKVTKLEEEIVRFDTILDHIQKVMPDDMQVYDKIVHVRDVIFQLQQMLHNCEIVEFAAPWIDPADIFWNKKKEDGV